MVFALITGCIAVLCLRVAVLSKLTKDKEEMERHCITPEVLHALLVSKQTVLLFDLRQPLDLLADSEIIPGAIRIPPQEVLENPSLIPQDEDSVVYCTCPSEKTSRVILRRALALHLSRIQFLKGGLAGWKAKGYAVEPYTKPFHLNTEA